MNPCCRAGIDEQLQCKASTPRDRNSRGTSEGPLPARVNGEVKVKEGNLWTVFKHE